MFDQYTKDLTFKAEINLNAARVSQKSFFLTYLTPTKDYFSDSINHSYIKVSKVQFCDSRDATVMPPRYFCFLKTHMFYMIYNLSILMQEFPICKMSSSLLNNLCSQ